jgi:predicted RND superfamily exporter protein
MIMAIIPFGAIGAVLGHLVMGLNLTLFSVFGLVALTGVVVNDSIVLIDFINHRVRDGIPLKVALLDAGRRRFRPVLLTSMTTVAGLLPLLVERSLQAQVIIPMATSLSFGLMFATALVLILVPTFYLVYAKATGEGNHEEVDLHTDEILPTLKQEMARATADGGNGDRATAERGNGDGEPVEGAEAERQRPQPQTAQPLSPS